MSTPRSPAGQLDPVAVVTAFLDALASGDAAAAGALIDNDILYVNVGFPAIRGAVAMRRVLRLLDRPGVGFDVVTHSVSASVSAECSVVHTERTDVLIVGRLRAQFWVWGRFEVRDGRITLWRDSFDNVDVLVGLLRGVLAAVVPSLAPALPGPGDAPGRRAGRVRGRIPP